MKAKIGDRIRLTTNITYGTIDGIIELKKDREFTVKRRLAFENGVITEEITEITSHHIKHKGSIALLDTQYEKINNKESKLTFEELYKHPTLNIGLNCETEEYLINVLKMNRESIIYLNDEDIFTYDNIPKIIKYLQDVYDFATELKKNIVEYVDFETAKEHMKKGNKAKLGNNIYGISVNDLIVYKNGKFHYACINLRIIDSKEWILL